ncbi:hypothetical protein M1L60_20065 [Actinoplanes sp. TRM 88003]|uniref:Gram-positive cocci surface proteins LPxTG domain-containing protein n=1 Tax=Paractinoplanes aksuensis TaxID=2939490 RepID=A0ABT1DPX0_9ACTN|nr:hypothetical protein [Actinoplanes aksuensis]MCO8272894.1 hypothetical protein [Actinoplanes aksuensis]
MRPPVVRRLFVALTALSLLFVAAPVQAAPAPLAKAKVDFYVKNYTLAPGSGALLRTLLFADRRLPVRSGDVSIVYRFVDQGPGFHFQEAGHVDNCSVRQPDLLELTCGPYVDALTPSGAEGNLNGWVVAGDDAVVGRVGTITATMTVKGHAPVTRTAKLRIGERIGLTAVDTAQDTSVAPGGSLDVPLTISNTGSVPIRGTAIGAYSQYSYESRTQFSNCFYLDGQMRGCKFDQTLAPGATYRVTLPLRMRKDTYAPSLQYGDWIWMTKDEFADQQDYVRKGGFEPLGTPGRGGVLRLTPVVTAQADPPQALEEYVSDGLVATVTGRQSTDLAAVGTRAAGRKGAVVPVKVGIRNAGPATIDRSRVNAPWPNARVFIPKGTTAVTVPDICFPMTDRGVVDYGHGGKPGELRYSCYLDYFFKVGFVDPLTFRLRIDQVITGAVGSVKVDAPAEELNKANNSAYIVINGAVPPAPPAAPGDGGGDGGQGGGGGLPITGPTGGLLGLGLVLAGAVAVLIGRRVRS